jgi:hypothetical protein
VDIVTQKQKQEVPKVLEAEQFVLRDGRGRARATLSLRDGEPAFHMLDSSGIPRMMITFELGGRGVIRIENDQGASIGMSVDNKGAVGFSISRQGGTFAFEAGLRDGDLQIVIYDQQGRPVWQAPDN